MGGITVDAVEDYIYSLLPERDEVLAEMEAEAAERNVPIVGPAVARIFERLDLAPGALGKPARTYSKGMTQKLGLAACLLSAKASAQ